MPWYGYEQDKQLVIALSAEALEYIDIISAEG